MNLRENCGAMDITLTLTGYWLKMKTPIQKMCLKYFQATVSLTKPNVLVRTTLLSTLTKLGNFIVSASPSQKRLLAPERHLHSAITDTKTHSLADRR